MRSNTGAPQGSAAAELRAGTGLIAAVILGSAIGPTVLVPYTAGVFMPALEAELGWTRGMVSLGVTVFLATTALAAPIAGTLADKAGVRMMLPASLLAAAVAFAMLSFMDDSYLLYLGVLLVLGVIGSGASTLIMSRILTTAFDRARGTALGLGLMGIGITSMVGRFGSAGPVVIVNRARRGIRSAHFGLERAQAICEEVQLVLGSDAHPSVELVQIECQLADVVLRISRGDVGALRLTTPCRVK